MLVLCFVCVMQSFRKNRCWRWDLLSGGCGGGRGGGKKVSNQVPRFLMFCNSGVILCGFYVLVVFIFCCYYFLWVS